MIFGKLIVMDDISGLADKSDEFANFFDCFKKIRTDFFILFTLLDKIGKW